MRFKKGEVPVGIWGQIRLKIYTCRVAFLQNLNVAIVNGVPVKQHVQLHQLPCIGTPFIAFRIAPSPPK